MRIVNKTGNTQDTKVLDSNGADLAEQLKITNIKIDLEPYDLVKATITTISSGIDLKIDELEVNIDVRKSIQFMTKPEKQLLMRWLEDELNVKPRTNLLLHQREISTRDRNHSRAVNSDDRSRSDDAE